MTDINKHNFLAELSKLLTFMYEEDRITALTMYDDMFDLCQDEQQLIHHLVSPTRQAVVLARAYDAKERMLSVDSRSKRADLYDEDEEQIPAFITVIDNIRSEAERLFGVKESIPAVSEDQFSLFAHEEQPDSPSNLADIPPVEEIISNKTEEEEVKAEPNEPEHTAPVQQTEDESSELVEQSVEYLSDSSPDVSSKGDLVDEFLAEYEGDVPAQYKDEQLGEFSPRQEAHNVRSVRRKRSIPLLILYSLVAIPICLIGVALLLIPTVISLTLAFVLAAAGISVVSCAFGSFVILADILVVLGTGLVLTALGLLFLWLFVWFIGGAIAGLINGAIKLGGRLCTREVSA